MSFYKTNSTEVLKAFDQHFADRKIMIDAIDKFALLFKSQDVDVKIFYQQSPYEIRFGSLKFNPVKSNHSWTKPDKTHGGQRIRKSLKNSTKEQRDEHKELVKKWKDNFPKQKASYEPLFESMGTNWANIMFSGGFKFFRYIDFVYVKTSIKLNKTVTEILGSEFKQAENNYRDSKK